MRFLIRFKPNCIHFFENVNLDFEPFLFPFFLLFIHLPFFGILIKMKCNFSSYITSKNQGPCNITSNPDFCADQGSSTVIFHKSLCFIFKVIFVFQAQAAYAYGELP